jgi:hypothetical protein
MAFASNAWIERYRLPAPVLDTVGPDPRCSNAELVQEVSETFVHAVTTKTPRVAKKPLVVSVLAGEIAAYDLRQSLCSVADRRVVQRIDDGPGRV